MWAAAVVAACPEPGIVRRQQGNATLALAIENEKRFVFCAAHHDAPALLVAAGSGSQMVNYRVRGEYYVVDRLFGQAVMVSGVGRQQDRVTIQYAGNAR